MKALVCSFNKEKTLVGALSWTCVTSRRFVETFSFYPGIFLGGEKVDPLGCGRK